MIRKPGSGVIIESKNRVQNYGGDHAKNGVLKIGDEIATQSARKIRILKFLGERVAQLNLQTGLILLKLCQKSARNL